MPKEDSENREPLIVDAASIDNRKIRKVSNRLMNEDGALFEYEEEKVEIESVMRKVVKVKIVVERAKLARLLTWAGLTILNEAKNP